MTENELITGCCNGDRKMQRYLYDFYSKKMFVTCLRYSKGRQEAEDILQESFIKVFQNLKSFRKDSSLETWIKRIVINTALNSQRGKLFLYPMVDIKDVQDSFENDLVLSNYNFKELLQIIQSLPTGCQAIFNLYAIEGYQHNEIAEMLGISEGTSKSQYARARQLLRKYLEENKVENYEKFRQ